MQIHGIGYHYHHDSTFRIDRPQGTGDYLLLLTFTPTVFCIKGVTTIQKNPCVILFNKNSPQHYRADQKPYCNDFLHFDFDSKTELSYVSSIITFDTIYEIPSIELLSRQIRELSFEHLSANKKKEESKQLILKLLFLKIEEQLSSIANNTPYSSYYHELLSLRSYIYNTVEQRHTVEELAGKLDLSPSYFHTLYKKTFHVSCIQDVINSKLEFAKYHLDQTNYSVKEIATLCGYENDVHFLRQFKKYTGYTPKQYRLRLSSQK
ncbi:AraC family transcriptional regulator [Anaerosporobacter faecicola]|uniref:AraC family transcriptional regulator n=1 Tax=Anaerosporobacter faecicola TaxID=2718714 RepID=UPI00143A9627|nr:AraC family transcriptional regulator [Anaerosporobacter faecicola]